MTIAKRRASLRAMPPADTSRIADFEKSLDELEQLVSRMEQGELSLDDSLKSFERGLRCIAIVRARSSRRSFA